MTKDSKNSVQNWDKFMERITAISFARTQVELAKVLSIRQSSISDAKRRGSFPPDWQVVLLKKFSANPEWIRTGEGPKYLVPSEDGSEPLLPDAIAAYRPTPPTEGIPDRLRQLREDIGRLLPDQTVSVVVLPESKTDGEGNCSVCGFANGRHAPGCLFGTDLTMPHFLSGNNQGSAPARA